jgi:hypothetical protein
MTYSNGDPYRAAQCFRKKDSDPPACGQHNAPLERKQLLSDKLIAAGYRGFSFFVCPVSGAILNEEATHL